MPSPETMNKKTAKSSNPFKAWKQKREAKKQALAEQAAMEITNDIANNENMIVGVLESVDFLHSRLPKDVIEAKLAPEHPVGAFQYTSLAIVKTIVNHPVTVQLDMRKIDEKLLTLAYMFKDSVENGELNTAQASQRALLIGVRDIRSKVPTNRPDLAPLYVEANAKHLDSWIELCGFAQQADALLDHVITDKALLETATADYEAKNQLLADNFIKKDEETILAFEKIHNNDSLEARASWTEKEREIHLKMVENRMDGVQLDLKKVKLIQDEQSHAAALTRLDFLNTKVANLPIVTDPNLMNKFQEEVDDLFKEFARADQAFNETLMTIDDIDGRIKQLDSAPGAVRAKEVAADEADKFLKNIRMQQDAEVGKNRKEAEDALKRLGIRDEEEQAQLKAEYDAQLAAEVDEIMAEEGTLLIN